jgi:hypothetical protein
MSWKIPIGIRMWIHYLQHVHCAALNNFLKLLYYRGKTGKFVQELTADFRQV